MHLIERYALSTGCKIDKPEIYQDYFPMPFEEDYIIFAPNGKSHKQYIFWQEVLNILSPVLEKENIKVVQVGLKGEPQYAGTYSLVGQTSINNLAYLTEKSIMYLGVDSFVTQIASSQDNKIVCLYNHVNISNRKPFWGDPKEQILIEPKRKNGDKPCYSAWDRKDYLNTIGPEKISNAVIDLLGIQNAHYRYTTIHCGHMFPKVLVDIVPTRDVLVEDYKINANVSGISIRMDWNHDEENLAKLLETSKSPYSVVFNKEINLKLLGYFKDKISELILIYDGGNIELFSENYLKSLSAIHKQISVYSHEKDEEVNKKLKAKCMEFVVLNEQPWPEKLESLNEYEGQKIYYKSNKRILADKQIYNCYFNYKNQIPMEDFNKSPISEIKDDKDFWKEVHFFHLLTKS
tara:strand:- start:2823 stop:4037 length:1215 start_codon:yes stop_codon:yes gene_type:complete